MSHEIGVATSAADLLNRLNTFLTTNGKAFGALFTGTGNGTISAWDGGASSVCETFTITATSSTSFSVVGTVSGNVGIATVGTQFTCPQITFKLNQGSATFASGDAFKINTCTKWTVLNSEVGVEMIWRAPGNDGLRQVYTGARLFSDAGADYYNWRLGGFTGYSSGVAFTAQPGFVGQPGPVLNLWNSATPYWFVANGQRVIVIAKISAVYVSAYLGLINPYVDPGYWPYPLFVGGSMAWTTEPAATSPDWRWSLTGIRVASFWRGFPNYGTRSYTGGQGRLRLPTGVYIALQNYTAADVIANGGPCSVWPFSCDSADSPSRGFQNIRENLDGTYPLLPIFFSSDNGTVAGDDVNIWGEFDGIRATTGHGNAAENTITEGSLTYAVFQETYRNEKDCYCAVALD